MLFLTKFEQSTMADNTIAASETGLGRWRTGPTGGAATGSEVVVEKSRMKPGAIVVGAMLPEPIRITAISTENKKLRVVGSGIETGKFHDVVLDDEQIEELSFFTPSRSNQAQSPLAHQFIYYFFSELLGCKVRFEDDKRPFGRLSDIGAFNHSAYALAASLEVKTPKGELLRFPWCAVGSLCAKEIVLQKVQCAVPEPELWVRRDVLDDQVVDISGAKVVRVNDVHMIQGEGELIFIHVEVGILGMLRRLGVERPVVNLLRWLLDYEIRASFVTWRQMQVILPGGVLVSSAAPSRLEEIHPAELADIMEQLGTKERQVLLSSLPVETAAETVEQLDPDVQRTVIAQQEPAQAADLLEEMAAEDAAAVLRDVGPGDRQSIMSKMERGAADDIREILVHHEESAGGVMSTSVIEADLEETAVVVFERVKALANEAEILSHIFVLDRQRRLVGVFNLRELLSASPETTVESLMTTDLVTVGPGEDFEELAKLFVKYGFRAIPVVDENNLFLGAVRLIRVVSEMAPFMN